MKIPSLNLLHGAKRRYGIYCAICHGEGGDGLGITSRYGVPGIANLHGGPYTQELYPDGRIFEVITKGKGQMGAYGPNISVRDRWAIITHIRALQLAKVKATEAAEAAAEEETPLDAGTEEVAPAAQDKPSVPPATESTPPTTPGAPGPGETLPKPKPEAETDASAPTEAEEAAQ